MENQPRFVLEIRGDRLLICYDTVVPADPSRRPTDFTAVPRSGRILLEFTRVKP